MGALPRDVILVALCFGVRFQNDYVSVKPA